MRVYLVRHGQTLYNKKKLFQDKHVPLSDLGREQAMETAQRLVGCAVKTILSSTDLRAKETADIIAESVGTSVEPITLLAEIRRPSSIVGKWHYNPSAFFIMLLMLFKANDSSWHYGDEENPCEHYACSKKALALLESHTEDHLIVVTHRVTLTMLLSLMKNGGRVPNFYYFSLLAYLNRIKNGSITVCDYDGERWHMTDFNESEHLQKETK